MPDTTTAAAITLADVTAARYTGTVLVREADGATLYAAERWYVPSASDPANPREVLRYRDSLLCPCPAFVHRGRCRHARTVAVAHHYRRWLRLLADADAATLRDVAADKGGLIRCGYDVADSRGCELAVEQLLRGMGAWEEEAA